MHHYYLLFVILLIFIFLLIFYINNNRIDNIDNILSQNNGTPNIVLFFAPWCGHCKAFGPVWQEFVKNFDGYNGVKIIKVNGDQNQNLLKIHSVYGFPMIKFCPNGLGDPKGVVYQGDRSIPSLAKFLQENTQ